MRFWQRVRSRLRHELLSAEILWQALHRIFRLQHVCDRRTVALEVIPQHVEYGIVLGAGVRPDGTISQVLRERLNRAVELANARPDLILVVSGDGATESGAEDKRMKADLVARGIGAERVVTDSRGYSTMATMERARSRGITSAVVVTNDFHAARAVHVAVMVGIDAYVVDNYSSSTYTEAFRPLRLDERRELVAHVKDWALLAPRRPWRALKRRLGMRPEVS
jgi:SanA protein